MEGLNIIEMMKFIGNKVPKYALKPSGKNYIMPGTRSVNKVLLNANGYILDGWYYEDLSSRINTMYSYTGVAYLYKKGFKDEKATFVDGKKNGEYEKYWDVLSEKNGNLKEKGNYTNDLIDGLYQRFSHQNSGKVLLSGYFVMGKREGEWKSFYETGEVGTVTTYENDVIISEKKYHRSGNLLSDDTYVNGKKEGPFVHYHDNGKISAKGEYRNDRIVGFYQSFYNSGNILHSVRYNWLGQKNGAENWYSEDGKSRTTGWYKDGREIEDRD
jgi:antitoxin component YwqK of YwqJK toxin-antitoxin module